MKLRSSSSALLFVGNTTSLNAKETQIKTIIKVEINWKKVLNFISKEIGDENVSEIPAVMGGEDFARYGRQDPKIPSLLFWLGGTSKENWKKYQNNEIEMVSIHSPFFAPDPKPTITTGIKAMTASALGLLK